MSAPKRMRRSAKPTPWRPALTREQRVASMVRATYDAATTSDRNENLWATATGRSADAEATAAVRATIRNRCRYEARNNSYCRGMLDTRANDTIGRCPRLELLSDDEQVAALVESAWQEWSREVRLGEKLRLAMIQRGESGEAFLAIVTDPSLLSPVKLNVVLIEADRVTDQFPTLSDPLYHDGIRYDTNGNPVSYDVLEHHPGDSVVSLTGFGAFRTVPASRMLHFYRQTRPGMRRGVPDIAPALNLFGMIRRYSLAVLNAAETAAAVAWAVVSKSPNVEAVPVDPEQVISLPIGSGLTMPAGWGIEQVRAEQPTTTHRDYIRALLNEAARCIQMPLNVALADSSQYNYASGRLDHQVYHRSIEIDRYDLGVTVLTPLSREWAREFRHIVAVAELPEIPREWYFDGFEHVDPAKEAHADDVRLRNRTLSYRTYYARRGQDWRTAFDQCAEEDSYARQKGITLPSTAPSAPAPAATEPDEDGEGDADGETIADRE